MAVKYNYRNQNKGNQWFIINFVTPGAFHETENIYDFIVSSLVKLTQPSWAYDLRPNFHFLLAVKYNNCNRNTCSCK